jgi:hypothetical protein
VSSRARPNIVVTFGHAIDDPVAKARLDCDATG